MPVQSECYVFYKGMSGKKENGNHSQCGHLSSPTHARAGTVGTIVSGGAGGAEKDRERGQLLYFESVAGKEFLYGAPTELFYSSRST